MICTRAFFVSLIVGAVLSGCASEPGREEAVPVQPRPSAPAQSLSGVRGDLARLPRIDPVGEPTDPLAYTSSARINEVVKFYRGQMALRGWNESALESDQRSYAKLRFIRAGVAVAVALNIEQSRQVRIALLTEEGNRVSVR